MPLSPTLLNLQSGLLKRVAAPQPGTNPPKVISLFSVGVLAKQNLLNDSALQTIANVVDSKLASAKALMNQLGYSDVTKAPAISLNQGSLRVVPGLLKTPLIIPVRPILGTVAEHVVDVRLSSPAAMGFQPTSVLPAKSSVIIASTLDLTHTNLVIDPSVNTLTIIVETLTCGAGAQITYDDSTVWNPQPLMQTQAPSGNSFNPNAYTGNGNDGQNGGNGASGQTGSPQFITPPAAPNVTIYALNLSAMPVINLAGLKGAPGNPGQNGGNGGNGSMGKNGSDVCVGGFGGCTSQPGHGGNGGSGGNGGNGGNGGEGSAGGSIDICTTQDCWTQLLNQNVQWLFNLGGGPGGNPGLPGTGGAFGTGGAPGTPGGGGCCNKYPIGNRGNQGANGAPGDAGTLGPAGTLTEDIITLQEWEAELTKPWLTTINPTQGPSGTQVTADGLNVSPGDIVLVNEQPVSATAVSTPSSPPILSAAQFKFTLPANLAGGTAHISLRRASDNVESDPMNFAVQPFISGSNAGGGFTPGDSIILNGSSFLTNASVHFTPPSQPEQIIVPGSVTATSVSFTVPSTGSPSSQVQANASVKVVNPDGESSNVLQLTELSYVTNHFRPSINGFSFTNTQACPGLPTLSTYGADFGDVEVAASFLTLPVLTSAYYALYAVLLGPECHGLCTGFATSAMKRFSAGETEAFSEPLTDGLRTEFSIGWARQMSGQLLTNFLGQCANGAAQIMTSIQQVEQTFSGTQTAHNMPIVFFIPSGLPVSSQWFNNIQAGHCLAPWKLVRPLGWSGGYNNVKLYLYDCNKPGDDACYLDITQSGNTLSFSYNKDSSYSSANGFTVGVLTMDQALYNSVDLPWVFGATWVVDFVLSPAQLSVNNLAGQLTGPSANNLFAQVPGVVPSLLSWSHNLMMIPRQLALQRTLQGTANGAYTYVSIAPPDPSIPAGSFSSLLPQGANTVVPHERGFTLQNVSCSGSTKDTVLLGPDNQSIQIATNEPNKTFDAWIAQHYEVQSGAAPNITSVHRAQLIQLSGIKLTAGEQLLLWTDTALGQIGVSNTGAAKNFNVAVSLLDLITGQTTASQSLAGQVGANADFMLAVPDWTQMTTAPTTQQGALRALLPPNFQTPTVK